MEKEITSQLLNNNELLIQAVGRLLENNKTTLVVLEEQKQVNSSLINHLKSLYEQLNKIPIKTKAEETKYKLLSKILLDFWDYR